MNIASWQTLQRLAISPIVRHATLALLALLLSHKGAMATQLPKPSLSEVVLFGLRSPNELETSGDPSCIRRYLAAIPPTSWLWRATPATSSEDAASTRRLNLIEQITVIHGEATREIATEVASVMQLQGEWEGMSEGPVAEAESVATWLEQHAHTPIAPFLHLLMAHRFRAAYEAAKSLHDTRLLPTLAQRYHTNLGAAYAAEQPLILCIAMELGSQPYVYLEDQGHP